MRLLVFTQKVKADDPILGFMIGWLTALSKQVETLEVICLEQGSYQLPPNVRVWSLGKESGQSRFKYLINFYRLIWRLRGNYNAVWVHMNQIYVLLGFLPWRLWNKKISLWYAHGSVSWSLRLAEKMVDVIFTSSPSGFRLPSHKLQVVGQGINTALFKKEGMVKEPGLLVHVGRISAIKHQKELIHALNLISSLSWRLVFYGAAVTPADNDYEMELKNLILELGLSGRVTFAGPVAYQELPACLFPAELFVTMSGTGSLDKAVLDAMAAGVIPVLAGETFKGVLGPLADRLTSSLDVADFSEQIKSVLLAPPSEKEDLRSQVQALVAEKYSLDGLIQKIVSHLKHVASTH